MIMAIVILAESALLVHRRNVELKGHGSGYFGDELLCPEDHRFEG